MDKSNNQITVTSPLLPPLEEFIPYLQEIWDSKWITNNGQFHQKLEQALCEYFGIKYISVFTNGTLPLITALQALNVKGEVITTPYSFVATTHSIWWNGLQPVFVDVDPKTGNIDPDKIEAAITPRTTAIMPVHVYGNPCDVERIDALAKKYNLKVIYDAAHAFGVRVPLRHPERSEGSHSDTSILNFGDVSTLSFHATKTYTTIEGGALVCHSAEMKQKIDYLKNFGFEDEVTVVAPGINSKIDEVRAAFGLVNLKHVDDAIEHRHRMVNAYREGLKEIKGITFFEDMPGVRHNYSYFPIFVDEKEYGISRDALYTKLKENGILSRRYFYPLISEFSPYRSYASAIKENLPVANKMADSVICLPLHAGLSDEDVNRVLNCIKR
ncbi:MAG: DegT/DnrJ/EryC1/StrS family aminotransferase [Paludibacteraceae bacterium]|nr:DegT/DnrJ/EryC1/StrS family aminotransferase [Paludibacteraceae bacterium]